VLDDNGRHAHDRAEGIGLAAVVPASERLHLDFTALRTGAR
jgi:hypothetical protein